MFPLILTEILLACDKKYSCDQEDVDKVWTRINKILPEARVKKIVDTSGGLCKKSRDVNDCLRFSLEWITEKMMNDIPLL